ncbi:uncharacterized protein LOC110099127 isoform X3 [Dendrobium catenatum]|uniref:uncharacterized protein LOC110099127 isoform X3 n=1 Tax=Dendrobium catenatum TaxID=906689 RepID=UPI0009F4C03D|nr:uncharacterized protein LOC110099127 isoform X3 [Dendrobium catenatum]
MEGEMDLELEGEKDCHCSNVDIEYEYDAPRYFELGRKELASEAKEAELWFETAGNYPPSPVIVKISFGKKGKQENIDAAFFKIRDVDSFNAQMGVYAYMDSSLLCGSLAGSSNPFFMKPTTSQLSTQNSVKRSSSRSVCQKPLPSQSRSSEDPVHSLLQAAKRQKVDGGLVCKVVGTMQESDLLHKSSKKECFVNRNSHLTKMRLTIPREPVLETARRAKTFRAHRSDHTEGIKASTSTFKALPLNRKILEAPSLPFPQKSTPKLPEFQEFKLKTSERAILRSMATTTSFIPDNLASISIVKDCSMDSKISEYQPSNLSKRAIDDKKARGSTQKLRSQNRNEKKCSFSTINRSQQHNPLSELFNKLSLSSETSQVNPTWT